MLDKTNDVIYYNHNERKAIHEERWNGGQVGWQKHIAFYTLWFG